MEEECRRRSLESLYKMLIYPHNHIKHCSLESEWRHISLWLKLHNWQTKSTHRGTWIKRYIKESTSVSLSGSPLNAWSFLIWWKNIETGGSAESILFSLYSLTFIMRGSEGHTDINKHKPPLRQARASAGLWAALLHKFFLPLAVCLPQ